MRKITIAIFCLFAVAARALTLEEAHRMAQEHYPLISDYGLIQLTEQYDIENASKAWLPQVSLGAQASWQSAIASYPDVLKEMLVQKGLDVKGIDKFQYKASIDVRQNIWDGGRIKAQEDLARRQAEEGRLQNDVEIYHLRSRIDDLFFSILLLQQQEEAINSTIQLLQANFDKVMTLLRNGAAMQSDADAVEVELLSTRQQLISVHSAISSYRAILGLYLGTDGSEVLDMPEPVILPADNNTAYRPENRLLNARIATLDAQHAAFLSSLRPRISAFVQGGFGYPGLNFMEAMMDCSPRLSAIIGVSASWDITPFYTKKNKLKGIEVTRQRVETARKTFEFNTDIQATSQRSEIERLRLISESDDDIVALRARVRNASEARLREGIIEPTDLLLRITEEKNALIAANSHKIEYLKALYTLLNTLNQ